MSEDAATRDRIARNEALFRQVNERVRDVTDAFADVDPSPVDFLCECGSRDCTEPVVLSLAQYEALRSEPTHFVVVPTHVAPAVEFVVSRGNGFAVVEKRPSEDRIARETDPRSS